MRVLSTVFVNTIVTMVSYDCVLFSLVLVLVGDTRSCIIMHIRICGMIIVVGIYNETTI